MMSFPDTRFTRPFQAGSLGYWERVSKVMELTGASKEEVERFIKQQKCCVSEMTKHGQYDRSYLEQ